MGWKTRLVVASVLGSGIAFAQSSGGGTGGSGGTGAGTGGQTGQGTQGPATPGPGGNTTDDQGEPQSGGPTPDTPSATGTSPGGTGGTGQGAPSSTQGPSSPGQPGAQGQQQQGQQQQQQAQQQQTEEKRKDVNRLAMENQEQVDYARLAEQRAQSPEVRQFAKNVRESREKQLSELQNYADSQGIEIAVVSVAPPAGAGVGGGGMEGGQMGAGSQTLDEDTAKEMDEHRKKFRELASKTGEDFDRAYLKQMRSENEEGIEQVEDAQNKYRETDPGLAVILTSAQPMLEQQQEQADQMRKGM